MAGELTTRHQRFVDEYRRAAHVHRAAERAGFQFVSEPSGFYVYMLTDSVTGEIFYVGKGKGRRLLQHEIDARRGDINNPRKTARIRSILARGDRVTPLVFEAGLDESDAFTLERHLIEALGKENLTNHSSGVETDKEWAKVRLSQMKPFGAWVAETNPSEDAKAIYWDVKREIERIAREGQVTTITAKRSPR